MIIDTTKTKMEEDLQVVMSEMQITKRLPKRSPLIVDLVDLDDNNVYCKAEPTVLITERAGYKRKFCGKYMRPSPVDKYRNLTIGARIELNRSRQYS